MKINLGDTIVFKQNFYGTRITHSGVVVSIQTFEKSKNQYADCTVLLSGGYSIFHEIKNEHNDPVDYWSADGGPIQIVSIVKGDSSKVNNYCSNSNCQLGAGYDFMI